MGVTERKAREYKKREAEILKAAFNLFKKHGLENVTIDMIADVVEIGKGTIYTHFKSKHEIYAALFLQHLDDIENQINQIDETLPDVEKFREIIRVYINNWIKNKSAHQIFQKCMNHLTMENLGPKILEKVHYHHKRKHQQHIPLIKKAMEDGLLMDAAPEYIILIVSGLLQGISALLAEDHFDNQHIFDDPDGLFSFIEKFVIKGLTK